MLLRSRATRMFTGARSRYGLPMQAASKAYYSSASTASNSANAAGEAASAAAGAGAGAGPGGPPPPYGHHDMYHPYGHGGWGWGRSWGRGWGRDAAFCGRHGHRRGGFLFFLLTFAGGMFAYKMLSGDYPRERWERGYGRRHESAYYGDAPSTGPAAAASKVDVQTLPIVSSLRSNAEYEEVHILDNQVISPTTNSTFDDSIILPSKPIEFANGYTGEKLAIVTLPDISGGKHGKWSGFGRRHRHRMGGQSDRMVMLVDEYMKQNAALFLNVSKSAVFTESLDVEFKSWMSPRDKNIIVKAVIDKEAAKEGGSVAIKGSIMTTDGQLISKIQGSFTSDSTKAPPSGEDVYHFRKWMWSD